MSSKLEHKTLKVKMAEKTRTERTTKPKEEETGILPILPVRDTVLFPMPCCP